MAKNFFKTFFNSNKDKNLYLKNPKITPSYKLSEIVTNTKSSEDSKILPQQQQPLDSYNLLLDYYSKKDDQNNIINNFMEKISKLNKKFHASSEKFVITKTSYDKLSDELFLNLFKQIDTYVEEIQRLNKKISLIDSKDNKLIIKNLTKELTESKEKIRNYEIKLREKTSKEEKLLKDIESYKRRIIFFKNKISINLMVRNRSGGRSRFYQKNRNDNNIVKTSSIKMNHSNYYNTFSRGNISKNKDRKLRKYLSPQKMTSKDLLSQSCFSSKNVRTFFQISHGGQKDKLYPNVARSHIDNTSYNTFSNIKSINEINEEDSQKNQITVNNKLRGFFSDGEPDDNSTKKLIKIRRSSKKESIIVPFKKIKVNKNYNKDDDDNFELIFTENKNDNKNGNNNGNDNGNDNDDDINKNINIDENKNDKKTIAKNALGKDLKSHSPKANERNNKFFENIIDGTSYNSEKGDKKVQRVKYKSKTGKKEEKKILSYSSTLNINNNSNKNKVDKTNLDNSKTSNKKFKNLKINTLKKSSNTKKIFNYPSKKFFASPKNISFNNSQNSSTYNPQNTIETNYKNNTINQEKSNLLKVINTDNNISNNNDKNTIEDTKFKTIENVTHKNKDEALNANQASKSKIVKFKPDDISEKDQKLQFTTSESENCEISGKELPKIKKKLYKSVCNSGNFSDNLSKGGTNNDNLSLGDNSLILKKEKKLESNKKKSLMSNKKVNNNNNKQNTNKKKPIIEKDFKLEHKNKQKEKELGKILKEMNEDYNNDIEMLKRQEEQLKLMLNLINLNEGEN